MEPLIEDIPKKGQQNFIGYNTLRNFVAWNKTVFYSHNIVASNSHDTLRDFVACAQQSCLVYHGLKGHCLLSRIPIIGQPLLRGQNSLSRNVLFKGSTVVVNSTLAFEYVRILSKCAFSKFYH